MASLVGLVKPQMVKGVTFETLSELLFAESATLVLLMTLTIFTGSIFSIFVILRTVLFVAERFELVPELRKN